MSVSGLANVDAYQDPQICSLLSGILVLGRISLSLKTRGYFLKNIFSSTVGAYRSCCDSNRRFNLSSDDQLRSAFEIADANGDGLLTIEEAIEAIQAINVSEKIESDYYEFLSSELTPSLSLPELALICGDLLVPEACTPFEYCIICLDNMIDVTHAYWCNIILEDLGESLCVNLSSELGNIDLARNFKALWKHSQISLDESRVENILLPTTASSSLTTFFTLLNFRVTHGVLSVDTIQDLIPEEIGAGQGSRACLVAQIQRNLREKSMSTVLSAYNNIFQKVHSTQAQNFLSGRVSDWKEDCALQCLFDLRLLRGLLEKSQSVGSRLCQSTENTFDRTLQAWEALIDPVNFEVFVPILATNLEHCVISSSLLFTGLNGLSSVNVLIHSQGEIDGIEQQQQQQQQQQSLFSRTQAYEIPKFGFLPLAITFAASKSVADNPTGRRSSRRMQASNNGDEEGNDEQMNLGKYFHSFSSRPCSHGGGTPGIPPLRTYGTQRLRLCHHTPQSLEPKISSIVSFIVKDFSLNMLRPSCLICDGLLRNTPDPLLEFASFRTFSLVIDDVSKHVLSDNTLHEWIQLMEAILALIECCTTLCESLLSQFLK